MKKLFSLIILSCLLHNVTQAQTTPSPSQNLGNPSFYTNYQGLGLYWLGNRYIDVRDSTTIMDSMKSKVLVINNNMNTMQTNMNASIATKEPIVNGNNDSSYFYGGDKAWHKFTASKIAQILGFTPFNPIGTSSQYIKGDGSYGTLPAAERIVRVGDTIYTDGQPTHKVFATQGYPGTLGALMFSTILTISLNRGDGNILSTNVTIDKAAIGLPNAENTTDLNKPISTATQAALNTKFNIPTGTTTQYLRGDGTLNTFPSVSVSVTDTERTRPIDGTVFQINTSNKPASVCYAVNITINNVLNFNSSAYVYLEQSQDGSTNWKEINSTGMAVTGLLFNNTNRQTLFGDVKPGWYVRLRTVLANTGLSTSAATFWSGNERTYN